MNYQQQIEVKEASVAVETNTIIYNSILILAYTLIIAFGVYHLYRENKRQGSKISFKEGLDLAELPIVTFLCSGTKLHFLLDTGSNISYIIKSVIPTIPHEKLKCTTNTIGVGGRVDGNPMYKLEIGYKDQKFVEEFAAAPLEDTFKAIEKESGIKLHGILGNKFFEKYRYILDFKELTAYR